MRGHKRSSDIDGVKGSFPLCFGDIAQPLLFLAVFLLSVAVIGSAAAWGSNAINNEENAVFAEKWQCSTEGSAFTEVTLPGSVDVAAGSRVTLKNHLPHEMVKGATVLVRTSQQHAEVTVGGEQIYNSLDPEHPVASPSSAYHLVRLPNDCAGAAITVTLSSPYDNYAGLMGQIYIGSKASNLFFLLNENGLRFVIGFLVFSVGLLLMLLFSFTKGKENRSSFTNLGAFFCCAGYWVMVESRMMQFVLPYPVALTNSSVFALTLMPVFSGLYYCNTHTKEYKKLGKSVVLVMLAASLSYAVSAAICPMLPIRILPHYLVLLVFYLLLLFVGILAESVQTDKLFSASVCGILAFGVCALFELLLYLKDMKAYNQSNFLTMGLLLFCVCMVVDSVQSFTLVYRAAIKVDALSVLAYTDSLTGLRNRTAFLEEMATLEADGEVAVTIAMYDVNNLKTVNDTKGHLVGDALLWHCAKAIRSSLRQEDKLYRIGGDEFVAILRHGSDFDGDVLERRLLNVVGRENHRALSYVLSIAFGFATFCEGEDQTLFDTQARADKSMYARKREQKAEMQAAGTE